MKLLIVLYIPFLQKLLFRGLIDKRESYIEIEKIEKVYGLYVDTKPKKICERWFPEISQVLRYDYLAMVKTEIILYVPLPLPW